jgi:hypothetical protein
MASWALNGSVALPIARHLLRGRSALPPIRLPQPKPHSAVHTLVGRLLWSVLHDVDELFQSPVTYAVVCASRRGQAMP